MASLIRKPPLPSAPGRNGSNASFWSCIPKLTGMSVCPRSSPDRAQHGHTITSYFLLSPNSLLSSQTQILSLGKREGQCRKFSLSKSSFPTILLLDFGFFFFFNLETKNLISLLSVSFMAGVAVYSCLPRLHLGSWCTYDISPLLTLKNVLVWMIRNINPRFRVPSALGTTPQLPE